LICKICRQSNSEFSSEMFKISEKKLLCSLELVASWPILLSSSFCLAFMVWFTIIPNKLAKDSTKVLSSDLSCNLLVEKKNKTPYVPLK